MCCWINYISDIQVHHFDVVCPITHVDWHHSVKKKSSLVCCHSVVAKVFIRVKGESTVFPKHSWDTSYYCHWTLTIKWRLQSVFPVIAADFKWLSANQPLREINPVTWFFIYLFFMHQHHLLHKSPHRFYDKGREDLEEDNSMSHHTFVLQARGEVSFMRRLWRHWKKQLMKTKLQFPDAFELPGALIWLSPFRLPLQL